MRGCVFIFIVLWLSVSWSVVPVQSERSLRQQFDSYVELLQKEVLFSKSKEKRQKFSLLSHALGQMKALRLEMQALTLEESRNMDTLIAGLEALPSLKGFKKKKCPEYFARLPQEVAAQPARDFLGTLCP